MDRSAALKHIIHDHTAVLEYSFSSDSDRASTKRRRRLGSFAYWYLISTTGLAVALTEGIDLP